MVDDSYRDACRLSTSQPKAVERKRATLSLQDTVQRAGSVHLAERHFFAPFSSSTNRAFHGERAGKNDR